jgi:hypothetical protein
MGLNYNPTIVPDGLVMYLDPANSRSYSGSGNTVYNLVNGGIAGTIVTGITYDNFSAKNLNFNGSSGYMFSNDTSMDFSTSDFTIQTTLELNGLSNGFSSAYGTVICAGAALTNNSSILQFVGTATSHFAIGLWHQPTTTTIGRNYNFQTNKIYNIAVVKNTSQVEFFVDGASIGTTTSSNFFNFTANGFAIGRWYYPGYEQYLKGNIYELKAYNRALSNQEIAQNYDAVKGRFVTPENIVTNGLILNFDSSKTNSYSGVGNTIYDLSGFGNTGTLTNGPTFSGLNGGAIVFDGVDDNIPFTISNFNNILSVEIWMKVKSFTAGHMPFGFYGYDVFAYQGALGFNTTIGDLYGLTSTQVTNLGLLNQWKHYIFEMRSDVVYTNNKIYVNGVIQTLSQVLGGGDSASFRNFNNGFGKISGWLLSNAWYQPMDLGSFRIYNRALTQQEVLQNYNATKSRFGL